MSHCGEAGASRKTLTAVKGVCRVYRRGGGGGEEEDRRRRSRGRILERWLAHKLTQMKKKKRKKNASRTRATILMSTHVTLFGSSIFD